MPQVCLQSAFTANLKPFDVLEGLNNGLLNEILRFREVAGPYR